MEASSTVFDRKSPFTPTFWFRLTRKRNRVLSRGPHCEVLCSKIWKMISITINRKFSHFTTKHFTIWTPLYVQEASEELDKIGVMFSYFLEKVITTYLSGSMFTWVRSFAFGQPWFTVDTNKKILIALARNLCQRDYTAEFTRHGRDYTAEFTRV